jgi:toxin-antitoxin system PIN domain toxin
LSARGYLFDVNIWVALAFPTHPLHGAAVGVFSDTAELMSAIFCRATEQGFLRIATTPAVLNLLGAEGFSNRDCLKVIAGFKAAPTVRFFNEPDGLEALWHRLADRETASPKVWMDAYLAAFAIGAKLKFVTADRGFRGFEREGLDLRLIDSAAV